MAPGHSHGSCMTRPASACAAERRCFPRSATNGKPEPEVMCGALRPRRFHSEHEPRPRGRQAWWARRECESVFQSLSRVARQVTVQAERDMPQKRPMKWRGSDAGDMTISPRLCKNLPMHSSMPTLLRQEVGIQRKQSDSVDGLEETLPRVALLAAWRTDTRRSFERTLPPKDCLHDSDTIRQTESCPDTFEPAAALTNADMARVQRSVGVPEAEVDHGASTADRVKLSAAELATQMQEADRARRAGQWHASRQGMKGSGTSTSAESASVEDDKVSQKESLAQLPEVVESAASPTVSLQNTDVQEVVSPVRSPWAKAATRMLSPAGRRLAYELDKLNNMSQYWTADELADMGPPIADDAQVSPATNSPRPSPSDTHDQEHPSKIVECVESEQSPCEEMSQHPKDAPAVHEEPVTFVQPVHEEPVTFVQPACSKETMAPSSSDALARLVARTLDAPFQTAGSLDCVVQTAEKDVKSHESPACTQNNIHKSRTVSFAPVWPGDHPRIRQVLEATEIPTVSTVPARANDTPAAPRSRPDLKAADIPAVPAESACTHDSPTCPPRIRPVLEASEILGATEILTAASESARSKKYPTSPPRTRLNQALEATEGLIASSEPVRTEKQPASPPRIRPNQLLPEASDSVSVSERPLCLTAALKIHGKPSEVTASTHCTGKAEEDEARAQADDMAAQSAVDSSLPEAQPANEQSIFALSDTQISATKALEESSVFQESPGSLRDSTEISAALDSAQTSAHCVTLPLVEEECQNTLVMSESCTVSSDAIGALSVLQDALNESAPLQGVTHQAPMLPAFPQTMINVEMDGLAKEERAIEDMSRPSSSVGTLKPSPAVDTDVQTAVSDFSGVQEHHGTGRDSRALMLTHADVSASSDDFGASASNEQPCSTGHTIDESAADSFASCTGEQSLSQENLDQQEMVWICLDSDGHRWICLDSAAAQQPPTESSQVQAILSQAASQNDMCRVASVENTMNTSGSMSTLGLRELSALQETCDLRNDASVETRTASDAEVSHTSDPRVPQAHSQAKDPLGLLSPSAEACVQSPGLREALDLRDEDLEFPSPLAPAGVSLSRSNAPQAASYEWLIQNAATSEGDLEEADNLDVSSTSTGPSPTVLEFMPELSVKGSIVEVKLKLRSPDRCNQEQSANSDAGSCDSGGGGASRKADDWGGITSIAAAQTGCAAEQRGNPILNPTAETTCASPAAHAPDLLSEIPANSRSEALAEFRQAAKAPQNTGTESPTKWQRSFFFLQAADASGSSESEITAESPKSIVADTLAELAPATGAAQMSTHTEGKVEASAVPCMAESMCDESALASDITVESRPDVLSESIHVAEDLNNAANEGNEAEPSAPGKAESSSAQVALGAARISTVSETSAASSSAEGSADLAAEIAAKTFAQSLADIPTESVADMSAASATQIAVESSMHEAQSLHEPGISTDAIAHGVLESSAEYSEAFHSAMMHEPSFVAAQGLLAERLQSLEEEKSTRERRQRVALDVLEAADLTPGATPLVSVGGTPRATPKGTAVKVATVCGGVYAPLARGDLVQTASPIPKQKLPQATPSEAFHSAMMHEPSFVAAQDSLVDRLQSLEEQLRASQEEAALLRAAALQSQKDRSAAAAATAAIAGTAAAAAVVALGQGRAAAQLRASQSAEQVAGHDAVRPPQE